MTPYRDVTDEEWQCVAALLPELRPRAELRGRPLANTRAVLNGVLWVMYSGATWSAMPRKYPSYQTCHRRFKAWHESGVMQRVMVELYGELSEALFATMAQRMRSNQVMPAADAEPSGAAQPAALVSHTNAQKNAPTGSRVPAGAPEDVASYTVADVFRRAA